MDETLADPNGDGTGTSTDTAVADGGAGSPYVANQTIWDSLDNGTVTGGSTPTPTGPSTTATYTPPSWLSSLGSDVTTLTSAASPVAAIINGQPAKSPVPPASTGVTTAVGLGGSNSLVLLVLVAIVAFFILGKRK